MSADQIMIDARQLFGIANLLGPDLTIAVILLTTKLDYTCDIDLLQQGDMARECAELREAKWIIAQILNPDADYVIAKDEMAWALRKVIVVYEAIPVRSLISVMYQIAELLGINLSEQVEIPKILDRKIKSTIKLLMIGVRSGQSVRLSCA